MAPVEAGRRSPEVSIHGHRRRARGQSGDAKAPVPAATAALHEAGLGFEDLDAFTTHDPFAVNDLWPDPTEPAG
jgi:hypothetical protein